MALTGRGIRTAVHVLALSSFIWSFHYLYQHSMPATQGYGGYFQYLTIWGLTVSTSSCALGLLEDLSAAVPLQILHTYMSFVAAGLETFLTFTYWCLVWYDENLVRAPRRLKSKTLDVSLHLNPFVFLMADILLFKPRAGFRVSKTAVIGLSFVLIFSYASWLERCRERNERYPYPIMEKVDARYIMPSYILLGTVVGLLGCALTKGLRYQGRVTRE